MLADGPRRAQTLLVVLFAMTPTGLNKRSRDVDVGCNIGGELGEMMLVDVRNRVGVCVVESKRL